MLITIHRQLPVRDVNATVDFQPGQIRMFYIARIKPGPLEVKGVLMDGSAYLIEATEWAYQVRRFLLEDDLTNSVNTIKGICHLQRTMDTWSKSLPSSWHNIVPVPQTTPIFGWFVSVTNTVNFH